MDAEIRSAIRLRAARTNLIHGSAEAVEDGGLASYGASNGDMLRNAAKFVHRILQGAKPGDLPIEQPTRFDLLVSLKTAGALGIKIPQAVLLVSGLLGGVYYPTHVIPSWIERVSDAVPLAYGLRALRHTLLDGKSIQMVFHDVGLLLTFATVLLAIGAMAYRASLHYARQAGSLSQY